MGLFKLAQLRQRWRISACTRPDQHLQHHDPSCMVQSGRMASVAQLRKAAAVDTRQVDEAEQVIAETSMKSWKPLTEYRPLPACRLP